MNKKLVCVFAVITVGLQASFMAELERKKALKATKSKRTTEEIIADFEKQNKELDNKLKSSETKIVDRPFYIGQKDALKQKFMKELGEIGLSEKEARRSLDRVLGKKVMETALPKEVTPQTASLELILKVGTESRNEIPEAIRKSVFKQVQKDIEDAKKRAQIVELLGADAEISDADLINKLRDQLALVEAGELGGKLSAEQAKREEKVRALKNRLLRDLSLSLDDISLDELPELLANLGEDKPEVPEFLKARLIESKKGAVLDGLTKTLVTWEPKFRKRLQKDLQELLEQILPQVKPIKKPVSKLATIQESDAG